MKRHIIVIVSIDLHREKEYTKKEKGINPVVTGIKTDNVTGSETACC